MTIRLVSCASVSTCNPCVNCDNAFVYDPIDEVYAYQLWTAISGADSLVTATANTWSITTLVDELYACNQACVPDSCQHLIWATDVSLDLDLTDLVTLLDGSFLAPCDLNAGFPASQTMINYGCAAIPSDVTDNSADYVIASTVGGYNMLGTDLRLYHYFNSNEPSDPFRTFYRHQFTLSFVGGPTGVYPNGVFVRAYVTVLLDGSRNIDHVEVFCQAFELPA